jgi:cupin fold WbuC family metalloprotein
MKTIDQTNIAETAATAAASPRKRAHYLLHEPEDRVQRILQVALHGSYYAPHMHSEKLEFFSAIGGRLAVATFDDDGKVNDVVVVEHGSIEYAQILPGTWHSVVVLDDSATFIEYIDGFYQAMTHKEFAPWAPQESDPKAAAYLESMTAEIQAYIAAHPVA